MLKVKVEKILQDYNSLVTKKNENLARIEADAKAYASVHGYNEEKTAKFVKCVKEIEEDGLSSEESAKLAILGFYIEEVAEELKLNVVPQIGNNTHTYDTYAVSNA